MILGKTTTPEFGWKALTDGPLFGVTRSPWNLRDEPRRIEWRRRRVRGRGHRPHRLRQ